MRNSWTQMLKPERTHYFSLFRLLQNKFWLNRRNMQRTHGSWNCWHRRHLETTLQISTADHAVRPLLHLRETTAREDQRATNKLRARSKPCRISWRKSVSVLLQKIHQEIFWVEFWPTLHRTFLEGFGAIKASDKESLVKPGEFGQFVLWQDSVQTKRTWYG